MDKLEALFHFVLVFFLMIFIIFEIYVMFITIFGFPVSQLLYKAEFGSLFFVKISGYVPFSVVLNILVAISVRKLSIYQLDFIEF